MNWDADKQWFENAGIPYTRDSWIEVNYLGTPPDEWTAEDENELPPDLQDWSLFKEVDGDLVYEPRGEKQVAAGDTLVRTRSIASSIATEFLWPAAKARALSTLTRLWDEGKHPRDPAGTPTGGQFTSGGGGGGADGSTKPGKDKDKPKDTAVAFVSPNTGYLTFEQAQAALTSPEHHALVTASHDVDTVLGKAAVQPRGAIGAWADGAENSLALAMPQDWTPQQVRVATAMKAWLGDQKQALVFTADPKGESYVASLSAKGNLNEIHSALLADGLAFHTLEPSADGATVHVWGNDQATADAIDKAAARYGTRAEFTFGHGEFIGTQKSDGSDREQRDDARREYEAIIGSPEARSAFDGRDIGKIWADIRDRWTGAATAADAGSGDRRPSGASSPEQAQRAAAQAASGHAGLIGLPVKPIKVGDGWYVPGPLGVARDAAAAYMKAAGLPYDPPTDYLKVDPARATRIANEFEKMKHDPSDPAVKASYAALAKEVLAQWQAVKATGLKIDWMKPDQPDPYAQSLRLAVLDVTQNNHLWVFPTTLGFGSGTEGAEAAKNDNPMLQPTGETVGGHKMLVNDVFRIVHDYFGHFKEGVGFRADGEENAWRSHAAMFTPLARAALTSETRGQNSWVNFGPQAAHNKTASPADTIYAPQKIGLMPEWTSEEGRADPERKKSIATEYLWRSAKTKAEQTLARLSRTWDEDKHPRDPAGSPTGGQFTSGGGGGGAGGATKPADKPAQADKPKTTKSGKPAKTMKDFKDDKIALDSATEVDSEKQAKFLASWNEHIDEDPAEFKKEFLGGIDATMSIVYEPSDDAMTMSGYLLDEGGKRMGEYTRTLNFGMHSASSTYFKLFAGQQQYDIGKTMLKANVDMYKKLGIDKVNVHANIDVGGYAWARYGYVPSHSSWEELSSSLIDRLDGGGGGGSYKAESWDTMSSDQQDRAQSEFVRSTEDEFRDSEIEDWRDSGRALDEAKTSVAEDDANRRWMLDTISSLRFQRNKDGKPTWTSLDDKKIAEAITLNYDSDGEGKNDIEVEFSDDVDKHLESPGLDADAVADMRDDIESWVQRIANERAEDKARDADPPDYIDENLRDRQNDYWDSMGDRDRFRWVADNAPELLKAEGDSEEGLGPIDIPLEDADRMRELLHSSDPKTIWAIADSKDGKEMLLGTDWSGTLNLKDPDTMERFNAYVGKAKAA